MTERKADIGRRIAAERDQLYKAYKLSLSGDSREGGRFRDLERRNPEMARNEAAAALGGRDSQLERMTAEQKQIERQLKLSQDYYRNQRPAVEPDPEPTNSAASGASMTAQAAPTQAAAAATKDSSSAALADVPWRKRRVAPQGMVRAQSGELSRLLGI